MVSCWKGSWKGYWPLIFPGAGCWQQKLLIPPCPCPLAFPNLEGAPRTQPWDSNWVLRPSGHASKWTLRHLYKFLRLQAWRSAHLPAAGISNIRKLLWLLKQPLINLAPSASFLGLSLLFVGPVSDFTPRSSWGYAPTPAIPLLVTWEDRKWGLSGMHPGKNETYQLKPTEIDFL